MKFGKFVAALALTLGSVGAFAQTYVEGTVGHVHESAAGLSASFVGAQGTVGYQLHPNVAIEASVGRGLTTANVAGANLDLTSAYGVSVKYTKPVTDKITLVARVSRAHSNVDASAYGRTASVSDTSNSWTIGGQYALTKRDYVSVGHSKPFGSGSTTTVALNHRF